ncbi:MAG: radical SAM family heme chaperone HemW [Lachnospiraceae bacterium]|nr:radical SAM family heme chaperone HemW [Lachnospiraceae bacterium]
MELYIHIPFCMKKCEYCDFLSMVSGEKDRQTYVDALCREIAYYGKMHGTERIDTIYIGGGTPSVVGADALIRLLECVKEKFYVNPLAEVTIELNPATIEKDGLHKLRENGVNRLSIGVQSTDNTELKLLGRIHTYEDFLRVYHDARAVGFQNINVDLMSSLPGQSVENYERNLDRIIGLQPEHISSYSLILEEETPFYGLYGEHPELLPTEEEDREMYRMTKAKLEAAGYERYEISNYARPGFESKHNSGYWKRIPYLGLGLGASSFMNHARWKNVSDLKEYLQIWDNCPQEPCLKEREELTLQDEMAEYMYLGLRMKEGVTVKGFEEAFHRPFHDIYGDVISGLEQDGLLAIDGKGGENERVYLTDFGIDVSNYVFGKFI